MLNKSLLLLIGFEIPFFELMRPVYIFVMSAYQGVHVTTYKNYCYYCSKLALIFSKNILQQLFGWELSFL